MVPIHTLVDIQTMSIFSNLHQPCATEANPLVDVAILMGLLNYLLVIIKIMLRWFSSFTKYLNTYSLSVNAYYTA